MNDRELLHWIVDKLSDEHLDEARVAIGAFLEDPVWRLMMTAPVDDEPLSQSEKDAIAEANAAGPWYTHEEVAALLGRADRRLVG